MAKLKVLYHVPLHVVGGAELQLKYILGSADVEPIITYQFDEVRPFIASLGALSTRQVKTYHQLACAINEFKPDVVQFFHSGMMYLALKACRKTFKTIEVVHNRHHFPGDATTYPKDMTDFVVFVSEDARDNFFKTQPMMPHSVVLNGVDTSRFHPGIRERYRANSIPVFGFHGRLESGVSKGIVQLFDLFKGRKDAKLQLVGQDLGGWEKIAAEFPNITVLPHVEEPEKYLAKWDVFISRSPMEGFGMSIAEALQAKVPSIVYNCGGIVRHLKDGQGVRIAQSDSEMKAFVNKACMGPAMLEISNADYNFSSEKMARLYDKLYRMLVADEINLRKLDLPTVSVQDAGKPVMSLSTCPTDWAGVRKSLSSFSDAYCGIDQVVENAKRLKPHKVIFAGMHPAWKVLVYGVRPHCKQIEVSLQGMPMLHDFHIANLDALKTTEELWSLKAIDRVTTPNAEWARVLATMGLPAEYQPNRLADPGVREQRTDGLHIGIFGSNQPWKNMTTQVLGAHVFSSRWPQEATTIHTQLNLGIPTFRKMGVNVHEYGRMDEKMFLGLAGSMNINMAVNLTDTFGYFCVESFLMGVPCLFSPMTAAMHDAPPELRASCVVTNVHSPEAIANGLERIQSSYDRIRDIGRSFCLQFVEGKA